MEATLKEQQREADIARRAEDMRKRMDKMSEVYREEVRGRVCWLAALCGTCARGCACSKRRSRPLRMPHHSQVVAPLWRAHAFHTRLRALQEKKDTAAREQADREHAEYLAALQAAERRKQQKQVRAACAAARGGAQRMAFS